MCLKLQRFFRLWNCCTLTNFCILTRQDGIPPTLRLEPLNTQILFCSFERINVTTRDFTNFRFKLRRRNHHTTVKQPQNLRLNTILFLRRSATLSLGFIIQVLGAQISIHSDPTETVAQFKEQRRRVKFGVIVFRLAQRPERRWFATVFFQSPKCPQCPEYPGDCVTADSVPGAVAAPSNAVR